jgi:long-chain fatty acid transport protein
VDALVPAIYSSYQVTDEIFLGLAVNSPFGLATEHNDGWVGRYHATDSELMTIDFSPTAAYRPFDWLNLGAGLQVVYASATLENAVDTSTIAMVPFDAANDSQAKVEGDDFGYGFTLGAIVEPMPGTRIGVAYRSEVDLRLEGDATFQLSPLGTLVNAGTTTPGGTGLLGKSDITADLTTPDSINFGIHHDINDQWSVMADGSWTGWSDFKNLTIKFQNPDQPNNTTVQNWNDTWFAALGTRFRPNEEWLLSLGVAYDESPIPNSTRTPRVPDEDRYWISAGAGWKPLEWLSLNLSYTHILMPDPKVRLTVADPNNLTRGNLSADYESNIDIITFSGTISF